jgi:hypothetical protein
MTPQFRRSLYLVTCAVVLILWVVFGHFDGIEAPYVRF